MVHLIAALLVLCFVPLLLVIFWDHFGFGKWGLLLAYLGNLSNLTAMTANAMRMPVVGYYVRPGLIWVSGYNARLPWLCDRFPMGECIYSLGDLIIGAGLLVGITWIIAHTIRRIYDYRRNAESARRCPEEQGF
jgi:hypothetical protein